VNVNPTASRVAIYLVGHGSLSEPRLIELQYRRTMRYYEILAEPTVPDIFTDLNLPRTSMGPSSPEELPALTTLICGITEQKYQLVLMDLQEGSAFNAGALAFIRPFLEKAGASVLNVFRDDKDVFQSALKARYGSAAREFEIDDGSDVVCFFPTLASRVTAAALRTELHSTVDNNVEYAGRINDRIHGLTRINPYARGKHPFIEDRLSFDWARARKKD